MAVALLAAIPAASTASPRHPALAEIDTFAFAIGDGTLDGSPARLAGRLRQYELVVVDGQEATRADVAALQRGGARVLAYLSVGTIERPRPWFPRARRYRLDLWQRWGEWYADTSRPGFRRLLARRVAPGMLRKGFDGLFLDNTDMVETHPAQAAGMRTLVARLSRLVGPRRVLMAQNGDRSVRRIARHLDGWNREDATWTYDGERRRYRATPPRARRAARAAIQDLVRRGLLVTTTDYTSSALGSAPRDAIAWACSAGAVPYVSSIELSRVPMPPPRCPRRRSSLQ